jgi:hypothetical protein
MLPNMRNLLLGKVNIWEHFMYSTNRATANTEDERLRARMAELDVTHRMEVKRLGVLLTTARKKLFTPVIGHRGDKE